MESHPFGDEVLLNARLSAFGRRVLDNDVCARAITQVLDRHIESTAGARLLGGEPSVCEENGRLMGGIQIGYERPVQGGVFRQFYYIDLFYFDPDTGTHQPTDDLLSGITETEPEVREQEAQAAWTSWLEAMRDLTANAPEALYRNKYTGELLFHYNVPHDWAVALELPES